MSIESWIGIIVGISTIITSAGLGVRWLVKHYFYELKPNGGSSLRDAQTVIHQKVDRIEEKQDKQGERIDRIFELLCEQKSR